MSRKKTGHATEKVATQTLHIDERMQRRIGWFGAPCLTSQEYRAVVLSLYGLPDVRLKDGEVPIEMEPPTQVWVAHRMMVSDARVSQLLKTAGEALLWFEMQNTPNVGWFMLPYGRGVAKWDFRAPVLDRPIPPDPAQRSTRVEVVRQGKVYKVAFAGEIEALAAQGS